jgi:hypothetical protein
MLWALEFHPVLGKEGCGMKEPAADYLVTPSAGKWKLILEYGERSYEAIGEAIEAGIEAAHAAGKSGCAARVLLQSADDVWEAVWIYGIDPYPPSSTKSFFGIS